MKHSTVYLRVTTPAGKSHVSQHYVWDSECFIASFRAAKADAAAKAKPPVKPDTVEVVSEEEYRKANWGKRS